MCLERLLVSQSCNAMHACIVQCAMLYCVWLHWHGRSDVKSMIGDAVVVTAEETLPTAACSRPWR